MSETASSAAKKAPKAPTVAEAMVAHLKKFSMNFAENQKRSARFTEGKKPQQTLKDIMTSSKEERETYMTYPGSAGKFLESTLIDFLTEINNNTIPADLSGDAGNKFLATAGAVCQLVCDTPFGYGAWATLPDEYFKVIYTDFFGMVKSKSSTLLKLSTNDTLMAIAAQAFLNFVKNIAFICSNTCGESTKVSEQIFGNALFCLSAKYPAASGTDVVLVARFEKQLSETKQDNELMNKIKNDKAAKSAAAAALGIGAAPSGVQSAVNGVSTTASASMLLNAINNSANAPH